MSPTVLSFLFGLAHVASLNEIIGGHRVYKTRNVLDKEGSLSAVISELFGDETMYEILMDSRLKTLVGDYSFLELSNKMHVKVDMPFTILGEAEDHRCFLTYERLNPRKKGIFDSIITQGKNGWSTSVKNFEVTDQNMYQLAIIALIDLMMFNYDRTTFRKGIAGQQHETNMMLYKYHTQHFSFFPVNNSWGLLFLSENGKDLDEQIGKFQDTIRYAVNNMEQFSTEYMDNSATPFFKGYKFSPFSLLFGTAGSVMKGWENINEKDKTVPMIKEFVEKFEIVWNEEIGEIVVKNIKKQAMKLDKYLADIQSRYDQLNCGKLSEDDVKRVKQMQQKILENVKIFEEQNKKQWIPLKQNAMNSYHDVYDSEDMDQEYDALIARYAFLSGYVNGYRKGRKGEN